MRRTLIMASIIVASVVLVTSVLAHSWYPWSCCHDGDCAPVSTIKYLDDGSLVVETVQGTALVPASFPRQPSQDDKMHACIVQSHIRCFFVPAAI